MDDRITQFIAGLRAAGVRVSLAESQDAFRAIEQLGIMDREAFRSALRTTLVKEHADQPLFDKLFPLYFSSGGPPLIPSEQAPQFVGQSIARQLSEQPPDKMDEADLMQRPFNDLSQAEARELRKLVSRLAAQLRSRAALRQKKGDGKTLDAKTTLRANIRTGGIPFDLR